MIDAGKLGWMAAMVDVKGHLIYKANKDRAESTSQIVLVIESSKPELIDALCRMTGSNRDTTRIQEKAGWMQRGCVEHCPEQHIHHDKNWPAMKSWTATGVSAAVVIYNLTPYLVADKPYKEFYDVLIGQAVTSGRGVGTVRKALLRLASLGWAIPPELLGAIMPEEAEVA